MTRSRRKTPISGRTGDMSERAFKAQQHRRERLEARQRLGRGEEPPHPKAFGNPWNGPKDGKSYYDPADHPEWLRK